MSLCVNDLKNYSEILKNTIEILGVIGGAFLLYKWVYERRDRGTDVLFDLEERFSNSEIQHACLLIENDSEWESIRKLLLGEVLTEDILSENNVIEEKKHPEVNSSFLEKLDKLLHFYILLCGVRRAKQVSDSALRTCFRYWLAHYYSPKRRELTLYINKFYPTLADWLKADRNRFRVLFKRSFFGPERFGWKRHIPTVKEIQRGMNGRVLVLTGAGISADSGIPTYRGEEGYWRNLNPKTLATNSAFKKDPKLIWKWYNERRSLIRKAQFNEAHQAIKKMSDLANGFLLVTQNVDDLHERSKLDNNFIVHIHGEIFKNKCTQCDYEGTCTDNEDEVPHCPKCNNLMRPGVVWFDEELDKQQEKRVEEFIQTGKCDIVMVIGTTAIFDYIVDWALRALSDKGILIEVNPEVTMLSAAADISIRKRAAIIVPKLIN